MRPFKHPDLDEVTLPALLHALSDPIRLDIVQRLDREGEASCSALDAGRPKSSMSHHFRVLRDSGLVRTRTVGASHMNSLRREEVDGRFPGLLAAVLASEAG